MNPRPPDPALVQRAIDLYRKLGTVSDTARELGMSETTVTRYLKLQQVPHTPSAIELPSFPDEDIPTEQLIDLQCKRFATRKASHEAHTWFPVKITENRPIGILWFGDPHVDDNGCNWPLLRRHAKLCEVTNGLYGGNIGDTTNNWGGRLVRLYANQDTSVKTARRLAEWFMLDSGVQWLIWLLGNHDQWGDGSEVLAQMAKRHGTQQIVCHDWEARFRLVFPSGVECKIFAAHDHPGNSMWNPLHGQVRAAKFGAGIDLIIAGHKHNWGVSQWEMPEQERSPLMVRVRGYKQMDDFARRLGIAEQETGQSILTIFNPCVKSPIARVLGFVDVEAGVDYLSFLRRRHK